MKLQNNYQISFKSGLSPAIECAVKNINTRTLERSLKKEFDIDAKFYGNKAAAGCFEYIINLCQEAFEKYKLPFNYVPPSIRLYKFEDVLDDVSKDTNGFCISEKQKVLKDEGIFDTGSIFIKELSDDIKYIDSFQELRRSSNHSSTSHFLGLFLHEWFHNIHLNLLFEKFNKNKTSEIDQVRILDKKNQPYNIIYRWAIKHSISDYASTNEFEMFPEVLSKLMANATGKDGISLKRNPMDELKNYPKFIQNYINREMN